MWPLSCTFEACLSRHWYLCYAAPAGESSRAINLVLGSLVLHSAVLIPSRDEAYGVVNRTGKPALHPTCRWARGKVTSIMLKTQARTGEAMEGGLLEEGTADSSTVLKRKRPGLHHAVKAINLVPLCMWSGVQPMKSRYRVRVSGCRGGLLRIQPPVSISLGSRSTEVHICLNWYVVGMRRWVAVSPSFTKILVQTPCQERVPLSSGKPNKSAVRKEPLGHIRETSRPGLVVRSPFGVNLVSGLASSWAPVMGGSLRVTGWSYHDDGTAAGRTLVGLLTLTVCCRMWHLPMRCCERLVRFAYIPDGVAIHRFWQLMPACMFRNGVFSS